MLERITFGVFIGQLCFSLNFGSTSFRNFPIDAFGFLFVCVWSVSVHLYLYLPRVFLYTVLIGVFHSDKLRDLLFTRRRSSPFSSGSASTGFTFRQPRLGNSLLPGHSTSSSLPRRPTPPGPRTAVYLLVCPRCSRPAEGLEKY